MIKHNFKLVTMTKKIQPIVKGRNGRILKKVDANLVFELAKIHCTLTEIAAVCKCSHDLIESRFHDEYARGREEGRCCLRRMQWQQALPCAMKISLHFNKLLKQSDNDGCRSISLNESSKPMDS